MLVEWHHIPLSKVYRVPTESYTFTIEIGLTTKKINVPTEHFDQV